jgi:NAD(P)-dependent dehydrogenase (short-subunit alcohol dehydrogenase family)
MTARVLITGGASGFGQALVRLYAARGDLVLVTDVHHDLDPGLLPDIGLGGEVHYLCLDVRDEGDWEKARGWVEEHWGGLDLLFNNAGVAAGGRIEMLDLEDWQWIIDINLLGVVRGCRTFVPLFKQQRHGRIVNTASMAGLVHPPTMSSYNAVKAAVVALSETLLHELSPYGVGVSVICPSFFRTNLHESLRGSDPEMEQSAIQLITGSRRDAATIAARAVKQIDRGSYLVLTHPEANVAYRTKRLVPAVYHRTMKKLAARIANRVTSGPESGGDR